MMYSVRGVIRSSIATVWLITAMALGTELSEPFKSALASVTGHHWSAKSLIAVIVFILLYFVFRKPSRPRFVLFETLVLIASVIAGGSIIFGFFVWHFFLG